MKTSIRLFLFLLAFASFMFSGCEPVDENTTGDDPRDSYVGEWQFIESFKSTEGQSYLVTITKDAANSSQLILGNFGNSGSQSISANGIVTSGQVVVSTQQMSNGWTVEGTGVFTNVAKTQMTWTYSITAGGDKVSYAANATLQ
ncbi:MAG: hypothetical protein WC780_00050 [Lentimicrobiaceae bacterium]|jgi:hypothetical protein